MCVRGRERACKSKRKKVNNHEKQVISNWHEIPDDSEQEHISQNKSLLREGGGNGES